MAVVALQFVLDPAQADPLLGAIALGDGAPKIDYGAGLGWEEVPRPRAQSFSAWNATPLLHQSVPIVLDGVQTGRDQLSAMQQIEAIAWSRYGKEPPRVRVTGPTLLHPEVATWVIETLEWDDNAWRDDEGRLLRLGGTIGFMEHRKPDVVTTTRGKKPPTTYKVKKGDTLHSIARKVLHDTTLWKKLLDLNRKKIKNPRHLKPGTVLRLPKV